MEVRRFTLREVHDHAGAAIALRWPQGVEAGALVSSYLIPDGGAGIPPDFARLEGRSFLYDDALLALERIRRSEEEGSREVLAALAALQLDDGSWGFSVGMFDGFYDAGFVRSGTVAFVVYAFAKYLERFGQGEPWILEAAERGAAWLLAQRSESTGLLNAGRGVWSRDGAYFRATGAVEFLATEHQLDAFFAFAALGRVLPSGPYSEAASALASSLRTKLWLEEEGRFAQGAVDGALDRGSALDAAGSWAALFLLACGEEAKARRALEWIDRHHSIHSEGWRGYMPYDEGPRLWFVEGSVAIALAWHRLDPSSGRGMDELAKLAALGEEERWPLPYSTEWGEGFPKAPAAGPTLWYLLVEEEIRGDAAPFLWSECPRSPEYGMARDGNSTQLRLGPPIPARPS